MPDDSAAYLILGICVLIGGIVLLWLISKRAPNGTILVISLLVYIATYTIDEIPNREIRLLSGAFRMLGVLGIIMGLIDVIRRHKPTSRNTPA